jgi:hypothetical protein
VEIIRPSAQALSMKRKHFSETKNSAAGQASDAKLSLPQSKIGDLQIPIR